MKKLLLFAAGAMLATTATFAQEEATPLWVTGAYNGINWPGPGSEGTSEGVYADGVYTFTVDFGTHENNVVEFKIVGDGWNPEIGGNVRITAEPTEVAVVGSGNNLFTYRQGEQTLKFNYEEMLAWFEGEDAADTYEPSVGDPDELYVIGDFTGWNIDSTDYTLPKVEAGVYSNTIEIAAGGSINFRFYTELGSWGADGSFPSIGPNPVDGDNLPVVWTDGVYEGDCVAGKGSWTLVDWPGGEITMTVYLDDMVVEFTTNAEVSDEPGDEPGPEIPSDAPEMLYVMGNIVGNEWNPAAAVEADSAVDGVFTFTGIELANDGTAWFTFINELNESWDVINDGSHRYGPAEGQDGALVAGDVVEFALGGDTSFNIPDGTYNFVVDFNSMTLTVSDDAGVYSIGIDLNAPAVYYNLSGVRVNNPEKGGIYVVKQGNKTSKVVIR